MNVDSIMTRHVLTVSMDSTLRHVRDLFADHGFHHAVVTEHRRVVGIVSDRDLLANISPFLGKPSERSVDAASLDRKVHQIMSRKLISVTRETPVTDAARTILEHRISCLPVLDAQGGCVGIVTWRDVLRWVIKEGASNRVDAIPREKAA